LRRSIPSRSSRSSTSIRRPYPTLDPESRGGADRRPEHVRSCDGHVRQESSPQGKTSLRQARANTSARTLLAGTIRTVNGKPRASLHLLDATNGEPLLHRLVELDPAADRPLSRNAFADVYGILATADLSTRVQRPPDPGLLDPVAREFIDAGLALAYRRGATDFDRGIGCLQRALELQPGSAAAHAALSKIMSLKAAFGSNREPLAPALELARKAVALHPTSSDARVALAAVLYQRGQVAEAMEEALTSVEYCRSDRRGLALLHNIHKTAGRADLALAVYALQARDSSTAADGSTGAADCLMLLLDDATAESIYHHYSVLHPDQPDGWAGLCRLRILQGRLEEARSLYQARAKNFKEFVYAEQIAAQVEFFARNFPEAEKHYTRLHERDADGGGSFYAAASYASMLGRLKMETDPVRGREILEQARQRDLERVERSAEHPAPLYRLAAIEASLGAPDAALRYLAAATSAGWLDFRSTATDPRFDAISTDPRFEEQLARMKARVAEQNRTRSTPATIAQNID
jgi:tetratricopeptide (TPR) repeat protein